MTPEDKARIEAESHGFIDKLLDDGADLNNLHESDVIAAYLAGATAELERMPKWKPISIPPATKGHVLCVKAGYMPFTAKYFTETNSFRYDGEAAAPDYWMYLDELQLNLPHT